MLFSLLTLIKSRAKLLHLILYIRFFLRYMLIYIQTLKVSIYYIEAPADKADDTAEAPTTEPASDETKESTDSDKTNETAVKKGLYPKF